MNQNSDEFLSMLNTNTSPLVIELTETWLNDDVETCLFLLERYHPMRMTNRLQIGEGVATLASTS